MKTSCVFICIRKFEDNNGLIRNRNKMQSNLVVSNSLVNYFGVEEDMPKIVSLDIQHTMISVLKFLILFRFYPLHTYQKLSTPQLFYSKMSDSGLYIHVYILMMM
jgi:hypothetical protein